jgi:hypothetical protein
MTDKNKFLDTMTEIGQEMEKARDEYEKQNEAWWNGLSVQEREDAFYAVCKRIWQADGIDNGTYRYALYDVFGFDPGMYGRGMDCGYMAIHNAIFDGEELQKMNAVNRFEVIDEKGRTYVNHLEPEQSVKFSLQDDNKTLKVFIDSNTGGL